MKTAREHPKRTAAEVPRSERVLKALQLTAIVIGAAWVAGKYFDIERALGISDLKLKNLQLDLGSLNNAKALHDLKLANARRIQKHVTLEAFADYTSPDPWIILSPDPGQYRVVHKFEIVNASEIPVTISLWLTDYFIGKRVQRNSDPVQVIGSPPNPWSSVATPGAVEWKFAGRVIKRYPTLPSATLAAIPERPHRLLNGGFGLGELSPGQNIVVNDQYYAHATSIDYVGVYTALCFDACTAPADHYSRFDYLPLTTAHNPYAPKVQVDRIDASASQQPSYAGGQVPNWP